MADKFDLDTHKRNNKGQIIHVQEYRMTIDGGVKKFERPVGSGQWYFENGDLVTQPKVEEKPLEKKAQANGSR